MKAFFTSGISFLMAIIMAIYNFLGGWLGFFGGDNPSDDTFSLESTDPYAIATFYEDALARTVADDCVPEGNKTLRLSKEITGDGAIGTILEVLNPIVNDVLDDNSGSTNYIPGQNSEKLSGDDIEYATAHIEDGKTHIYIALKNESYSPAYEAENSVAVVNNLEYTTNPYEIETTVPLTQPPATEVPTSNQSPDDPDYVLETTQPLTYPTTNAPTYNNNSQNSHAVSRGIGTIESIDVALEELGMELNTGRDTVMLNYNQAYIECVINQNGYIESGTWHYVVDIYIGNAKAKISFISANLKNVKASVEYTAVI